MKNPFNFFSHISNIKKRYFSHVIHNKGKTSVEKKVKKSLKKSEKFSKKANSGVDTFLIRVYIHIHRRNTTATSFLTEKGRKEKIEQVRF